jgi:CRP-like cAMP-binding protein
MSSLTQINRPPVAKTLLESASGGPLPEWDMVENALRVRNFEAGGTVFSQDVAHPYVYVVRSGLVKLSYLGEDGS